MRLSERKLYQRHSVTLDIQTSWRTYPIRIVAPTLSRCHRKPSLLAQSINATFVEGACTQPGCGRLTSLSVTGFKQLDLWVVCPKCGRRMSNEMPVSGYGFSCGACHLYVPLADLLPRHEDVAALIEAQAGR